MIDACLRWNSFNAAVQNRSINGFWQMWLMNFERHNLEGIWAAHPYTHARAHTHTNKEHSTKYLIFPQGHLNMITILIVKGLTICTSLLNTHKQSQLMHKIHLNTHTGAHTHRHSFTASIRLSIEPLDPLVIISWNLPVMHPTAVEEISDGYIYHLNTNEVAQHE